MATGSIYKGIQKPIDEQFPTENDDRRTLELDTFLQLSNRYESNRGRQEREDVIRNLVVILNKWVKSVSERLVPAKTDPACHRAHLFSFGSYRLGVNARDADIDTVCIVPGHLDTWRDFFGKDMPSNLPPPPGGFLPWPQEFRSTCVLAEIMAADTRVKGLVLVTEGFTPIMTFVFSGVEIDLACGRILDSELPVVMETVEDNVLKNLEENTIRSLNGTRVAHALLEAVPDHKTFRVALRLVKFWATRRGIYSNKLGYLGGVQLAILTAKIAQLYPRAAPSKIVSRFFKLFATQAEELGKLPEHSTWKWPYDRDGRQVDNGRAVELVRREMKGGEWSRIDQRMVWQTQPAGGYGRRQIDLMPIITPAYPAMNSTYNVNISTLRIMNNEWERGRLIIEEIDNLPPDQSSSDLWKRLVQGTDFFSRYKRYMRVDILAADAESLRKWGGLCESQLRTFVESVEKKTALKLHAYPKSFSWTSLIDANSETGWVPICGDDYPTQPCCESFFIGYRKPKSTRIEMSRHVETFKKLVINKADKSGYHTPDMTVEVKDFQRKNLPTYLPKAKDMMAMPREDWATILAPIRAPDAEVAAEHDLPPPEPELDAAAVPDAAAPPASSGDKGVEQQLVAQEPSAQMVAAPLPTAEVTEAIVAAPAVPSAAMDMGAVVEQLQSSGDEELDDAPPQHRRHLVPGPKKRRRLLKMTRR